MKTSPLFFTKGKPTEKVWYYDRTDAKVGKRTPMTLDRVTDFLALLPTRADSERSWTVSREELEKRRYDLKVVNPHARNTGDDRNPGQLLKVQNEQNAALQTALEKLRGLLQVLELCCCRL